MSIRTQIAVTENMIIDYGEMYRPMVQATAERPPFGGPSVSLKSLRCGHPHDSI